MVSWQLADNWLLCFELSIVAWQVMLLGKNTLEKNTESDGRSLLKSATKERSRNSRFWAKKKEVIQGSHFTVYIWDSTVEDAHWICRFASPQIGFCSFCHDHNWKDVPTSPPLFGIIGISIKYFLSIHNTSSHMNHYIIIKMNYGTHSLFNQSQSLYG